MIKIDPVQLGHFLHGQLCEDNNRLDVFISRINTIRPVVSSASKLSNSCLQEEEEEVVEGSVPV